MSFADERTRPAPLALAARSTQRARNHTWTGLRLMIVGFALIWFSLVALVEYGGILCLVFGSAFLWFGRRGFNEAHRRWAARGAVLLFLGLLSFLVFSIVFQVWLANGVVSPGETPAQTAASLRFAVEVGVLGTFAAIVTMGLGFVTLPYGRADTGSRLVLWAGFGALLILALVSFGTVLSELLADISAALQAAPLPYPTADIEGQEIFFGLLQIVPCLLFIWGYLRIRKRLFPGGKREARAAIGRDLGV
jgi:hypothetical protein